MSAWTDHVSRWHDCTACPLHQQRDQIVLARGTVPCDILFIGEAPGASEDVLGVPFCVKEDHRVLMSDLTWKSIGQIQVGDSILAPDESGEQTIAGSASGYELRRWRIATVTTVRRSQQPCWKLVTERGTLIMTPDHSVLTTRAAGKTRRWLRVDQLKVQQTRASWLAHILTPWDREGSYEAGWVGGFLDGEGNVPKSIVKRKKARLGFAQNRGPICETAKRRIRELGYECVSDSNPTIKNEKVRVLGGFNKIVELLGRTRPERLITNFINWIATSSPKCYGVKPTKLLEIDKRTRSPQNVVDIKTTTGTFVCEGFIVHNCGPAGHLLDAMIASALTGPQQQEIRWALTNLVACYPAEAKARGDNEPEYQEILACRPRLVEFITLAQPKLIVCVGALAAGFIPRTVTVPRVEIIHPAAVIRMPMAQKQMAVQRAVVILRNAVEDMVECKQEGRS